LDELRKGAQLVTSRLEKVHASSGSFGWEGTLAEYAQRLVASKEEEEP